MNIINEYRRENILLFHHFILKREYFIKMLNKENKLSHFHPYYPKYHMPNYRNALTTLHRIFFSGVNHERSIMHSPHACCKLSFPLAMLL